MSADNKTNSTENSFDFGAGVENSPNEIISSAKTRKSSSKLPLVLICAAVVLVATVLIIIFVLKPGNQSGSSNPSGSSAVSENSDGSISVDTNSLNQLSSDEIDDIEKARAAAYEFEMALRKKLEASNGEEASSYDYEDVVKEFSEKLDSLDGVSELYFAFRYAQFVYNFGRDPSDSIGKLSEAVSIIKNRESLATNDVTKLDYYVALFNLYTQAGKNAEAEIYQREINSLTTPTEGKG